MKFLMSIRVQTFKFVTLLIASLAKEEVIAILAHPTPLKYYFLAIETLVFLLLIELRLKHGLEFMIWSMGFRTYQFFMPRTLEITFLT